jgi:type I restriction enzyme R subunit
MQQAIATGELIDVPFIFSSNGDAFMMCDSLEALEKEIGKDFDPLDLICHVVFDQPPLTRKERANNVRKRNYFSKYGEQARTVLNALLDKYADEGIEDIESLDVLKVKPISDLGTPLEIIKIFGGKQNYLGILQELKHEIYNVAM